MATQIKSNPMHIGIDHDLDRSKVILATVASDTHEINKFHLISIRFFLCFVRIPYRSVATNNKCKNLYKKKKIVAKLQHSIGRFVL